MLILPGPIQALLGDNPFDTLMSMHGEVYRSQPGRETLKIYLDDKPYFIKRHTGLRITDIFKPILNGRLPTIGAETEWEAIQSLTKLGVLTTPLIGYGERGVNPFKRQSFVLTEALEDTLSLEDITKSWKVALPNPLFKRKMIEQVARITRLLHVNKLYHRDLYLCHFLKDGSDNLHLIDLHRMRKHRLFSRRELIKDLSALLFSSLDIGLTERDIYRFLRVYANMPARDAIKRYQKILEHVRKRAIHLYAKAYQSTPKERWLFRYEMRFPRRPGVFQEQASLNGDVFFIEQALRVLKNERYVMEGRYQDKHAILKVFAKKKDRDKEYQAHQALMRAGFHVPLALYKGELESYHVIVYQYLSHAKPVHEMSEKLIKTIAHMHEAGFCQVDCHRDNFFEDAEHIYLLDAGGMITREGRPLREHKSLNNLAWLFAQWEPIFDARIPHFLSLYLTERGWVDDAHVQERFIRRVRKVRLEARRKWLSKIYRSCTTFIAKHRLTKRYVIERDFASLYTQTLCEYPEAYFYPDAIYLKQGHSATVVKTLLGDHTVVIKRFNAKNIIKRLKRLVTSSKASRAWKMSFALLSIGIQTPKPLAFMENRVGPLRGVSYLVTEFVGGQRLDGVTLTLEVIHAIVKLMLKLKLSHCVHGDLKMHNLIWDKKDIYLLDTEGAYFIHNTKKFEKQHEKDWQRLLKNWEHDPAIIRQFRDEREALTHG